MNNEFFLEQLRIAEIRVNEKQKIETQIIESKKEVLREFVKPVLDFIFFINENYTFNAMSGYIYDKTLIDHIYSKDYFIGQIGNNLSIRIRSLIAEYGEITYLIFRIDDNMNCSVEYSHNTTRTHKVFTDIQSFIIDFSKVIAENKDKVTKKA